jgi:D-3-phosphoglycerate dehydrogenase/C-terminal binding protein
MKRFLVLVTDHINDDLRPERERLADLAEVRALDAHDEAELVGLIDEADALMVYHNVALTAASLSRLKHCRLIVRVGVGYDNVDGELARQKAIPLVNIPDYGTEEVADSAIGMMLALTRGIFRQQVLLREQAGPWAFHGAIPLHRLRGRNLAVVGLGRIGTATALRARSLGMEVLFYDPYRPDGYDKALGIRRVDSLEELYRRAYVLSFHCPLTAETRGLFCQQTLGWLPHGAYLVNTARGAIIDTQILPDALASGKLAGVALDVLPGEPPKPDDPLLQAWRDPQHAAYTRVILNPHSAFYCEEGLEEMRCKAAHACRQALLGQSLRNVVN